jgi:hypothetical protein
MKYLSNFRKFSLECGPFLQQYGEIERAGIFGEHKEYDDIMHELEEKIEKLHVEEENKTEEEQIISKTASERV